LSRGFKGFDAEVFIRPVRLPVGDQPLDRDLRHDLPVFVEQPVEEPIGTVIAEEGDPAPPRSRSLGASTESELARRVLEEAEDGILGARAALARHVLEATHHD
jgi:hypothetical protein